MRERLTPSRTDSKRTCPLPTSSPPSTQQGLKQPVRSLANIVRRRKKNWVTAEILDLCDKRRELRKKRFKPEGAEKYKEVSNIKWCMKKATENRIEQCSEIEENLRKNNSKRAYQLVKDLTTVKQGKATTVQDSGKCLTEDHTEQIEATGGEDHR